MPNGSGSANRRTALITGASAGIGAALAEQFAAHGFDLVLVARRRRRLEALAERLAAQGELSVRVVVEDLSDPEAPARIFEACRAAGVAIDALVNDAGYALRGGFLEHPWAEQADLLQVMIVALTELCHRFAPGMVERGWGRILNLASIAAFSPPYSGSLYNAAKAFVLEASQALDRELAPAGVRCLALCPGLTRSEFHEAMGIQRQVDRLPAVVWMDAARVAREGFEALMQGRSVYVPGRFNRGYSALMRHLPIRWRNRLGPRKTLPHD